MSKIYHGSIEVVESPEIRQPNRSLVQANKLV